MGTKNINKQLASKFYLFSIGLYAAIASIFLFLYLFQNVFRFNQILSIFIGYFITVLWRAFYDQLIIYKLKLPQINLKNNFFLALIGAIVLASLYYFIKPLLGEWSVPITIIISMKLIGRIKKFLWPTTVNGLPKFFQIYTKKLKIYTYGLYGFFLGIALITSQFVKLFGLAYFYFAFAISILLCLFIEQLYGLLKVYETQLTKGIILIIAVIAVVSSIICSTLVFILMQEIGFSGKAATICGLIILKLIQPLLFNKLTYSYNKY
jgi:hypothetical protein